MKRDFYFLDNAEAIQLRTFIERYFEGEDCYQKLSLVRHNILKAMKATADPSVAKAYDAIDNQIWDNYERKRQWAARDMLNLLRLHCPRYMSDGKLVREDVACPADDAPAYTGTDA